MAPYISSHLRGRVWSGTRLEGAQWDILQNLVANTRSQGSAAASLPGPAARPRGPQVVDRTQPLVRPAPVQWQCVSLVDSGWPLRGTPALAGVVVRPPLTGGPPRHACPPEPLTYQLGTVASGPTVAATGDGESGFDSGEGA